MISASALLPHVLAVLRVVPHIPRPMAPVINRRGLGKVQGAPSLAGLGAAFYLGRCFQGLTEMGSTGPQAAWTMNLWTRREIREDVSMRPRAGRHMLWSSPSCSLPNRDIAAESEMPDSDNGLAMRPESNGARAALLRLNDSPRGEPATHAAVRPAKCLRNIL